MKLIDGGMHGTLNATWAGNIQRAEWPARNNRSTSSGLESHYFDFYVEVPSASGDAVYLGYVSYDDYELRVFNDKYEIWLRGGGSALGTHTAATAGRRNIGIRAGQGASVWVDGVEIFGGGPSLVTDTVAGFGSKAVHHGGDTYTPGLTLFENLNYQRAWYRTVIEDEERIKAGGRVVVRTFDGPQPVVHDEVVPTLTVPEQSEWKSQFGDSAQVRITDADGTRFRFYLPNGRRQTGIVVEGDADAFVWDGEGDSGELLHLEETLLPGVSRRLTFDAAGADRVYTRSPHDADIPDSYAEGDGDPEAPRSDTACITSEFGSHISVAVATPTPPSSDPGGHWMSTVPPSGTEGVGQGTLSDDGTASCACRDNNPSDPMVVTATDTATGDLTNFNDGSIYNRALDIQKGGNGGESWWKKWKRGVGIIADNVKNHGVGGAAKQAAGDVAQSAEEGAGIAAKVVGDGIKSASLAAAEMIGHSLRSQGRHAEANIIQMLVGYTGAVSGSLGAKVAGDVVGMIVAIASELAKSPGDRVADAIENAQLVGDIIGILTGGIDEDDWNELLDQGLRDVFQEVFNTDLTPEAFYAALSAPLDGCGQPNSNLPEVHASVIYAAIVIVAAVISGGAAIAGKAKNLKSLGGKLKTAFKKLKKRISSKTLRRRWERENGKPWPKDPKDASRNQDACHTEALADGGSNEVGNIEPKPHDEHVEEHKANGDFKRWGGRRYTGPK